MGGLVARRMAVSQRTVERHVANALGMLGPETKDQGTGRAVEHGVRPFEPDRSVSLSRRACWR
jgi:hypothetical protein